MAGGFHFSGAKRAAREVGAGAGGVVETAFRGPVAQWSLQRDQVGGVLTDRSGNNNHLSSITWLSGEVWFPDMQPGQVLPWRSYQSRGPTFANLTRAMTVVFRNFLYSLAPATPEGRVLVNFGPNNSLYHTPAQLSYLSREIFSYNEGGAAAGPTGLLLPYNRWCFVAVRRRADGRMVHQIDDAVWLSPGVCQPSSSGQNNASLNRNGYGNAQNDGIIGDVNVWDYDIGESYLADARKQTMGL